MKDSVKTFKFKPRIQEKHDLRMLLHGKKKSLVNRLSQELKTKRVLKWFVSVQVKLMKPKADGSDEISEPHFHSLCMTTFNDHEIEEQLGEASQKILSAFSTYQKEGSGWTLSEILHLDLNVAQYKQLKGFSYLPLPKKLEHKKAIINVGNEDNKCFTWSVLAALHPIPRKSNPERIHHYRPYVDEVNVDGIEFPVRISKMPKFEKQNKIAVNLFGFEGYLFPVYITKEREFPVHVNLLLFSRGEKRHYCLIRNLNRLLSNQTRHKAQIYYCPYCLHGFVREQLLEDHKPLCSQHGPQRIELPNEDNMFLQFKDFHKQLRVPFVIYADFESLSTKIQSASPDPTNPRRRNFRNIAPVVLLL